jgi:hypothetical protein
MAKAENPAVLDTPVAAPAAEQTDFPMGLDEFCARLSSTDKRVEMISAFHHLEKLAGKLQDTGKAYANRYTAFINRPCA